MVTQQQIESKLKALSHGAGGKLLPQKVRGIGKANSQITYQVGRGMTPSDVIATPVDQSAAESRSNLFTRFRGTKRKRSQSNNSRSKRRRRSKTSKTKRKKKTPRKKKRKTVGKKKRKTKKRKRKGKVTQKRSDAFTRRRGR